MLGWIRYTCQLTTPINQRITETVQLNLQKSPVIIGKWLGCI